MRRQPYAHGQIIMVAQ